VKQAHEPCVTKMITITKMNNLIIEDIIEGWERWSMDKYSEIEERVNSILSKVEALHDKMISTFDSCEDKFDKIEEMHLSIEKKAY